MDTPEYLAMWARSLVKAAGKPETRLALAEYRRLAGDRRVPRAERQAAAERAKAIEKYLGETSLQICLRASTGG